MWRQSTPNVLRRSIKLDLCNVSSDCSICLMQKESLRYTSSFFKVIYPAHLKIFKVIYSVCSQKFSPVQVIFLKNYFLPQKVRNYSFSRLLDMKETKLVSYIISPEWWGAGGGTLDGNRWIGGSEKAGERTGKCRVAVRAEEKAPALRKFYSYKCQMESL